MDTDRSALAAGTGLRGPFRTFASCDSRSRSGNPKWSAPDIVAITKIFRMSSISEIQALIDGPIPAELQPAIDEYCLWQTAHVEAEQKRVQVLGPLYHYTGLNALRGIIGTESVWCTDYRYMNDKNELSHGVEVGAGRIGPPGN